MAPKILYILSSYNLYGGTPKKTRDLMTHFGQNCVLYTYEKGFEEFRTEFEKTGAGIYEGYYGRNIFKHVRKLVEIIDREQINIVQTQFSMGELLGYFIKLRRPHVKVVIAFVSAMSPSGIKAGLLRFVYKRTDAFVFISYYVKREKTMQFNVLRSKPGYVVYNGSKPRKDNGKPTAQLKSFSVLAISGLIELKNIQTLVSAFQVIATKHLRKDILLYVAGDGPYRNELSVQIEKYGLNDQIHLIGYQENVGKLLADCAVFVHPSYNEGFGIVVAEAMLAEKPIIVSKAGALPELIDHGLNGIVADPLDYEDWAKQIVRLANEPDYSKKLAENARKKADELFSYSKFTSGYEAIYHNVLNNLAWKKGE